jgi:hypothetical protein
MHAMYGPQFFDDKFIYSLTMVYSPPVFRSQKGVVGHVLGGWIIAPLFTAHSGAPWNVYSYAGGCQSFGETNCATGGTLDGAVLNGPFTFGNSVHYGLTVPEDAASNPLGVGVNSNPDNGGQGVNLYSNPVAAYNDYRNCVLGFDTNCGSNGNIRGVPFWNLDATISKDIGVWKEGRVGATLIFQITNILNHVNFNNPYLDISDPADFGVMGTSNANGAGEQEGPRNMEFGVRIHF